MNIPFESFRKVALKPAEGVALSGEKGLKPEGTLENLTSSGCRRCKGQRPESLRQKDRAINFINVIAVYVLLHTSVQLYLYCFSVVTPELIFADRLFFVCKILFI